MENYTIIPTFEDGQFVGIESMIEVMVSRLGIQLGFPCLFYDGDEALVKFKEKEYQTYVCYSRDFLEQDECYQCLDFVYRLCRISEEETLFDFCKRAGLQEYLEKQIIFDYLIINEDRNASNVGVIIDRKSPSRDAQTLIKRDAPLFDHGMSLIHWCRMDTEWALKYWSYKADYMGRSYTSSDYVYLEDNLKLVTKQYHFKALTPQMLKITFWVFDQFFPEAYIAMLKEGITYRYNRLHELGLISFS